MLYNHDNMPPFRVCVYIATIDAQLDAKKTAIKVAIVRALIMARHYLGKSLVQRGQHLATGKRSVVLNRYFCAYFLITLMKSTYHVGADMLNTKWMTHNVLDQSGASMVS